MNIAVIGVGILPTASTNGIPAFHAALRELAKTNRVTVYSFIPILKNEPNIRVRCVSSRRTPQRLQYLILAMLFLADHWATRYDIIHAQSPFPAGVLANRLARYLRIPWVLSFHAGEAAHMPEVPYGDLLNPDLKTINTRVTRSARFIMAMSIHQAEMIRINFEVNRPIIVLPRGVVASPLPSKTLSVPWKFIHVSYHQPVKGSDMLLETFAYVCERIPCELRIVGGNYGDVFKNKLADAGLEDKVVMEGILSHDETIACIERSDFLIHTSFCEGLPMVALEAMAHGTVVCGTAVGVMCDLSPSCCLTVKSRDPIELGDKIMELCRDHEAYMAIRENAWKWTASHDINWYVGELFNRYLEIKNAW